MDLAGRRAERLVRADSRRRYREMREELAQQGTGAAVAGPTKAATNSETEMENQTEMTTYEVPTQSSGERVPEEVYRMRMARLGESQPSTRPARPGQQPGTFAFLDLEITQGDYASQVISDTVGLNLGMRRDGKPSRFRNLVETLLGRALEPGDRIEHEKVAAMTDVEFRGMVEDKLDDKGQPTGYQTVTKFMPLQARRGPVKQIDELLDDAESNAATGRRVNQPAGRAG